jgi:lipopolysaccharide transport system ATP-binding protein
MSSDWAIEVDNLAKCYELYDRPRDRLLQMIMRGHRRFYREFWALRQVSFKVAKGETIGIIGRNGSGKSTLLQIICGTLNPTAGRVVAHGRIAALLELGSGFNPEFTGKENVYMNSSVLGLAREEIDQRYQAILAFADIGDFIDQPVKTYSSGMTVRLAFAVAINVEPQIMIIDEALAVGDELFQRKCFARLEEIKARGATILFVSHSGATIVALCDRAILLDNGEMLAEGPPKRVVGHYQKLLFAPTDQRRQIIAQIRQGSTEPADRFPPPGDPAAEIEEEEEEDFFDPELRPSSTISYASAGAVITEPEILTLDGRRVNNLIANQSYRYRYTVAFSREAGNVRFGMLIKTIAGIELGGAESAPFLGAGIPRISAGERYLVCFSFTANLTAGTYFMNAGVLGESADTQGYLHRVIDIVLFRVLAPPGSYATSIVDFRCQPEVIRL